MSDTKDVLDNKTVAKNSSSGSLVSLSGDSQKSKHAMSYEDALVVLHTYHKELRNASGLRLRNDVDIELEGRTVLKTTALSVLLTVPAAVLDYTNTVDALVLAPFAWGGLALFFGGFPGACSHTFVKIFSPLKMKKQMKQHALTESLIAIKEADYADKKAKILKKAAPVLAIVNEKLKEKGKEVFLEESAPGLSECFQVHNIGETRSYMSRALHYAEDTELKTLEASAGTEIKTISA